MQAPSQGAATPAFELRDVSKHFGSPTGTTFEALRQVRLTIPSGLLTTIVGPSGSGKSTLLSILGLLDRPTSGTISVNGIETETASEPERCSIRATQLGFVFQAFHLMHHRTVLDNVTLGGLYRGMSRNDRIQDGLDKLGRVGLGEKAQNKAGTLSGGERQRAAIARALVGEPSTLLCDEPTGNLDSRNGAAIVELLTGLAQTGISVVVVTHDPQIASLGRHQIQVMDGLVTSNG